MRTIATLVGSICILGNLAPAGAAELKLCDDIKEDQSRMACLQEHIVHLEGDIVRLEGDISQMKIDLEQKLAATPTYKLQASGPAPANCQAQNRPSADIGSRGANRPGEGGRATHVLRRRDRKPAAADGRM